MIKISALLMCVCLSFPAMSGAQNEVNLAAPGPWPDSSFRIKSIRRLDAGRILVLVSICSGKDPIEVSSLNPKKKSEEDPEREDIPGPYSLEGSYLLNPSTQKKYPLQLPKAGDPYFGRRALSSSLPPKSSSTVAAIFPVPPEAAAGALQLASIYLPGAKGPINVAIPKSPAVAPR